MKYSSLSRFIAAKWPMAFVIVLIAVFASACGEAEQTATDTPRPTATNVPPTDTPSPTDKPSPTPTDDPGATADVAATQTAEVLVGVVGEVLAEYGFATDSGHLGWYSAEPLPLTVEEFNETKIEPFGGGETFSNFLLHTKVTWNTTTALAGCGIILRSEEDLKLGEQYRFLTIRFLGIPVWDVILQQYGVWQFSTFKTQQRSSYINQGAESTNEYFFVLDGPTLLVYVNGTRIGGTTLARRSSGVLGVFAYQETGVTSCTFTDSWVWVLEE